MFVCVCVYLFEFVFLCVYLFEFVVCLKYLKAASVSIALCVVFFYQPKPNISQLSNSEIVFMIVFGTASSNGRYDRFAKNLVTNEVWSKVENIEVLLTN